MRTNIFVGAAYAGLGLCFAQASAVAQDSPLTGTDKVAVTRGGVNLGAPAATTTVAASISDAPVFGIDLRQNRGFSTTTSDYVPNFLELGPESRNVYGLDFDATATTLYGVDDATLEVLVLDPMTGAAVPNGTLVTGAGITGLTGLTAAADGVTWYLSDYNGTDSVLFSGSITTGVFTQIGVIAPGSLIIDIAIDSNDNLYGLALGDDNLYSIDTMTGVGTAIGPIGLNANFAQGMDFDWSDDTLYAPVYTGGGTGMFCSLDVTTGVANQLQNTLPLNAEMVIAVQVPAPSAGSPIYGVNLRLDESFSSNSASYVSSYSTLAVETRSLFGVDFNADASTLYAVDNTTLEVVTIDTATGLSTPTGTLVTGAPGLSGLTASTNGSTWYISDYNGTDSELYVGNIDTGVFTFVGNIAAGIIIDIAVNSQGELYGFSISDDSLYSIDPATGAGTVIGTGIGVAASFAQGMDFDWADDTLYATVYTGGGVGAFCAIDTVTGVATVIEVTTPLNAEMEMAVESGAPLQGDSFCQAVVNSTGSTALLCAAGSSSLAANNLSLHASRMPMNAFGIFITSQTQDLVPMAGGGAGTLCLGGAIGRGVGGVIYNSGMSGSFSAAADLAALPSPTGPVAAMAGETWNFQAWFRDASGGVATSNYSNGISVVVE